MSPTDTSERGLESLIVTSLVNDAGYLPGDPKDFDREHAVNTNKQMHVFSDIQTEAVSILDIRTLKIFQGETSEFNDIMTNIRIMGAE